MAIAGLRGRETRSDGACTCVSNDGRLVSIHVPFSRQFYKIDRSGLVVRPGAGVFWGGQGVYWTRPMLQLFIP
jgi:hypothetical protein